MYRICILFFLVLGCLHVGNAQQVPIYSQYMFNGFLLNPALAGSEGYTIFNITAREDWLTFDGYKYRPKTQTFCFQTRLFRKQFSIVKGRGRSKMRRGRSGKVGWGGYLYSDQNALINRTGGQLSYAYHLTFNNAQLSFGLAGTFFQFKIDNSLLDFKDEEEVNYGTLYAPDADFGVHYQRFGFFSGFSVTNVLQTPVVIDPSQSYDYSDFRVRRHYNLWSGQQFETKNSSWKIEPSFLLRASENRNFQIDLNTRFLYQDVYWTGVSLRSNRSVIAMAGASKGRVYFGYALEYTFNSFAKKSYGSHEIMISLKLGDARRRYRWLKRY